MNQISLRHLHGATLNAAQVLLRLVAYLAIVAPDEESARSRVVLLHDLDSRHEAGYPHIVVALFGQQELARQLHLGRVQ